MHEVKSLSNSKLIIDYPGRQFQLKAKSEQERDQWVIALNSVKAQIKLKRMENDEATPERTMPSKKDTNSQSWKTID